MDDVIILGKLDKKELEKSIDELVALVDRQMGNAAVNFDAGISLMESSLKRFHDYSKTVSGDLRNAFREMGLSFDAVASAQQSAVGGGANGGGRGTGGTGGGSSFDDDTVGKLREQIREAEKFRDTLKQWSPELEQANRIIEDMRLRLRQMTEKTTLAQQVKNEAKDIGAAISMPTKSISEAEAKLQRLLALQQKNRNMGILDESKMNRLQNAIDNVRSKIERMKTAAPKSLKEVMGMDESSVDAVARKMQALKRVSIDPKNAAQVRELGNEYQRLSRLQAELLGKGIQLTKSNNYLAQSFGYIRNRVVYALTLGAISSFTKQIYEVRAQYELLERSLGILIDNMRRGSEIFNELNEMALKSPFTLMELATGAKQLLAYNFAEDEVVETTRRLADISAALGVPMERLVYNLGQIRAQTVLNARDARDFANAGFAIVPMLAEMYTKQKKFGDEIVTTAHVYDMMSKKLVSYSDVMKVINSITDEGGKFFNFQAKQAETMKVQMNNLTLAWNNMLNEIGTEHQSVLAAPLKGLRVLFENWKTLSNIISEVIIVLGTYKTVSMIVATVQSRMFVGRILVNIRNYVNAIKSATTAMETLNAVSAGNPIALLATVLASVAGYFYIFGQSVDDASGHIAHFGESGGKVVGDVEALYGALESLDKESSTYGKVVGELNQILGDFNLKQIDEKDGIDEIVKSRERNIQLIKEEILERNHLNAIKQGKSEYDTAVEDARNRLRENLKNNITENFFGFGTINEEIARNAPALTTIISDIIERNIDLVANKTGEEYEKGVEKIFATIRERLKNNKALGLSDETINSTWLENNFFRFYKSNIIRNVINDLKDAKEANESYNQSINENYEAEKKAAGQAANFNDRVQQSSDALMKAANDTDKFYGKIDQLIKDYSGQNIIDFLVRVNADVPTWMSKMNGTELARLSARFAALASQAQKAGKEGLNVNGVWFTTQQLYERSAQYAQALKKNQDYLEERKSTSLTNKASKALQDYKSALEAANVARNKFKRGKADQSLVTEKETEAQEKFNQALDAGVSKQELLDAKTKGKKKNKKDTQKDPLGEALQKEIQLVTDIQKLYKEYQKAGVDAETAKVLAAKEYNKTLATQNATLRKFNITGLTGEQLASMDLRQVRDYYQGMLETATKLGNTKGVEALEKALRGLNEEITKIDYKKITDGLNNELGKLKDEYELAIELDASPELGDMFADMFQIDMESLPRSFGEALDRAQQIIDTKLSELNVRQPFDLLRTQIESIGVGEGKTKGFAELAGLDMKGDAIQGLLKWQQTFRDMFKKNITETEKMLDDYVKKYGGYADRMAEIEADRLQKVKRLNEAYYTEEMRRLPEYVAKMQAIEKGAEKERGKVKFDEFKDSRLYVAMFENLEYASTATLEAIREKLQGLKKDMGQLTPEQLKQVTQQFEKIDRELLRRNPFKGLIKNAKEYAKALGADGKKAQETFRTAQRKYDWELGTLATLKQQFEQKKAQQPLDADERIKLQEQVDEQQKKVDKLKEELELAEKLNEKYDMMRILFGEQAKEIAKTLQTIAANLQSLGELRDTLQNTFGFEFSHSINGAIDALTQVGNGLSKITSSAQSGDAVGVVTGVVTTISGIGDTIASIFGDGAARTRRINREIENSVEVVRRLNMAYKELERQVTHAMGAEELRARRSQIENKKAQLAELERQMQLEQSKRSKDRDDDAIKQYEESIQDLRYEIADLVEDITNTLLGSDLKGASEEFVSVWVDAWRQGGDTMDALKGKFDDMIDTMIAKSLASSLVSERLEGIWKAVKDATSDLSEGGVDITMDELQKIRELIGDKTIAEQINDDLTKLYGALNIAYGSGVGGGKNLSALQQGIQGITEETAGALEAYWNANTQQQYVHTDLLTQIRDTLIGFDMDVQTGALSQILLQLQTNYTVMMSIHGVLEGVLNPSGRAFNVELLS